MWFAVGMTLGLIGDLFMAELLIKKDYLYGGIAAFGLGHIAYIIGMAGLGAPVWTTMLIWWVIGFVGWIVVVWLSKTPLPERLSALPYTLLLASTSGFAFSIPNLGWVALGAALFLLSDLILAAQLFRGVRFRWISDVVWFTYGPGQMFIVYGVMIAMGKFNV